jgi:hypothetical protein
MESPELLSRKSEQAKHVGRLMFRDRTANKKTKMPFFMEVSFNQS